MVLTVLITSVCAQRRHPRSRDSPPHTLTILPDPPRGAFFSSFPSPYLRFIVYILCFLHPPAKASSSRLSTAQGVPRYPLLQVWTFLFPNNFFNLDDATTTTPVSVGELLAIEELGVGFPEEREPPYYDR